MKGPSGDVPRTSCTSWVASFTYSSLGKKLDEQTKNQVDDLKSLNISNIIDELNQIKSIFPQNQMNNLILDRSRKINQLQNSIE